MTAVPGLTPRSPVMVGRPGVGDGGAGQDGEVAGGAETDRSVGGVGATPTSLVARRGRRLPRPSSARSRGGATAGQELP